MVLLIGGTGCSGKTKLANTLMKKFGFPYISIDHIMMGIYRSNKNCGYNPMSDVATINRCLWPVVLEMIKTNIENQHSIIFEGVQILPQNIDEICGDYSSEVVSIFLCLSPEYIDKKYNLINQFRSVVETRTDIDDLEIMKKENIVLINGCNLHSKICYVIKNDYNKEISEIIEKISSNIKVNLTKQEIGTKKSR